MYSVILPTMWIPLTVGKLISDLNAHDLISEIIVIDNSQGSKRISLEPYYKVVHIVEKENIYVNPAWNKGYKNAKKDKLLIINDDVNTDWDILEKVQEKVIPNNGMIGLSKSAYTNKHQDKSKFNIVPIKNRSLGYGCLFFIHRDSYIHIPENLKIHYGDDYLFNQTGKPNFQIEGWSVYGLLSQTVNTIEISQIIEQDKKQWTAINSKQYESV